METKSFCFIKLIFIFGCLFSYYDKANSQEYYSGILEVCLKDNSAKPKNIKSTYNAKLNYIFRKNKVKKYVQSLPFAKTTKLRNLYTIEYEGNDSAIIADLKKSGLFLYVKREPKPIPLYDPSDYMWYLTTHEDSTSWLWHLKKIQADKAWDITKGDTNVKIAIIDTWFDINHPDLENKIFPKFDPYDSSMFYSSCFINNHGTTVASFAGAETDGGGQLASVGFNVRIIAYNWDDGLNKAVHASTVMGADVISISWHCCCSPNQSGYDSLKIKEILNNGTIICAAAGNGLEGSACPYPGASTYSAPFPFSPYYDERIISVTSTDVNDNHTFFAHGTEVTHSHFPEIDICAPGYNVMGATSTLLKDTVKDIHGNDSIICVDNDWPYYGSFRGTSFATPIVAGVCGLMRSVNPCLTPSEVQTIIKNTADPVQDSNSYPGMLGAGRINAFRAVKEAGTKYIQNVYITGTVTYKSYYSLKAGNNVTNTMPNGDVIVENGSNVVFKSKHEIILENGFEVKYGATFTADIDSNLQIDCNNE